MDDTYPKRNQAAALRSVECLLSSFDKRIALDLYQTGSQDAFKTDRLTSIDSKVDSIYA